FGGFVRTLGLFLDLLALLLVLFLLAGVLGEHLLGAFVFRSQQVDHIFAHFRGVQLDPRGLVIGPLVVGPGFVNDRRRVGAVAGDGYNRQQNRQNGCHDSDLSPYGIGTVFVLDRKST